MDPPLLRYTEYRPAPTLGALVECYWTIRGTLPPGASREHHVLPDGCMDVIFDLEAARAYVVGTMTRPLQVVQAGAMELLGVRFRPGAAPSLLGLPADPLVDDRVDFAEGWGAEAGLLLDRIAEAGASSRRLELLNETWEARARAAPSDRLVLAAARHLRTRTPPSVGELADALGLGRRTLERRFREAVGLSPWHLARVERFRRAVDLLLDEDPDLSRAAHGAGYHDQPHMTREFGELAGLPPGAWLERRRRGGGPADAIVQDVHEPPL